MNEIVDSHVHLLPGRLAEKVREFFYRHINAALAYPIDHAIILDHLARAGVGTVWSLPYAHRAGVAAGLNEASAATAARYRHGPVKVIGGATVHPQDSDAAGLVEEALDRYGLPVLKLHCSVGNFKADDPGLAGVWEVVERRRMPVIIHLGHAVSGHTEAAELAQLETVARNFPGARLIVAHCGHQAGPATLDLVEKYPAIYADLTPVVTETVQVPAARVQQLAAKLLYGSDAPNVALTIEQSLAHIKSFTLTPEAERDVLGGTARRLLSEVR